MNIVEFMREHPNFKVKRNKKVSNNSTGSSDVQRGLYKGILSSNMLRDKKAINGLIYSKDQEQ
jgi:hypothetical protein